MNESIGPAGDGQDREGAGINKIERYFIFISGI